MITINYQSKDPLYLQIKNRISELIVLGVYPPGTKLPSVRSLAADLGINPNTIQKAFQELEASGIICSITGKGNFVAENSEAKNALKMQALKELAAALAQAHTAGATRQELEQLILNEYKEERL